MFVKTMLTFEGFPLFSVPDGRKIGVDCIGTINITLNGQHRTADLQSSPAVFCIQSPECVIGPNVERQTVNNMNARNNNTANTANENAECSLPNGNVQLSMPNGNVQRSMANGNVQPSMANGNVQPSMANGNVQRSTANGNVQRSMANGNVQPSMANGNVQPLMANGNLQRSMANENAATPNQRVTQSGETRPNEESSTPNRVPVTPSEHVRATSNQNEDCSTIVTIVKPNKKVLNVDSVQLNNSDKLILVATIVILSLLALGVVALFIN